MASIIVPSRRIWTRQPPQTVEVDWSNPLAAGLVFSYDSIAFFDAVSRTILSPVNGTTISAGAKGKKTSFVKASSQYITIGDPSWVDFGSGDFSFEFLFSMAALPASNTQQILFGKDAAFNRQVWVELSAASPATCKPQLIWSDGSGYSAQWLSNDITETGRFYHLVMQRRGNSVEAFLDGASVSVTSAPAHSGWVSVQATSGPAYIGAREYVGYEDYFGGDIVFFRARKRALSRQEALSSYINPWQLFAPVNSPVFYSLPSGGTTTTTITVDAGSLALTGSAITQTNTIAVTQGSVALTGSSIAQTNTIEVTQGSVALTGSSITQQVTVPVTAGTVTLTGSDIAVSATGSVSIDVDAGSLALTGSSIAAVVTVPVTQGSVTLTGSSITADVTVPVTAGAVTLTGSDISVAATGPVVVPVDPGSIVLTGSSIEVTSTGGTKGGAARAWNKKKPKKRKPIEQSDDALEAIIDSLKAEKEAPKKVIEQVKEVVKLVQKVEPFIEREQDDDDEQEVEIEVKSPDKPLDTSAMMLYIATLISKTNTAIEAIGRLESKLGRIEADMKAVKKASQNAEELAAMLLANEY